jgi:hypothetical protein
MVIPKCLTCFLLNYEMVRKQTRHFAPTKHWLEVFERFSNQTSESGWARHPAGINYIQADTGGVTSHLYQ